MTHHKNGPSVLWRRVLCPASMRMEENEPDTSSEAAKEGTMLHDVVEARLSGKERDDALTPEQEECVEKCVDYANGFAGEFWTEKHLSLVGPAGVLLTEGTADLVVIFSDSAVVIDWKFGRGYVDEASGNIQLAAYSAMIAQRWPNVKKVVASTFTPRQRPMYSTHEFKDFATITQYVANAIQRTELGLDPRPGERQCRYCKGAAKCPALRREVATISNDVAKLPPLATMPVDQLSELVDQTSAIVRFHELVKSAIRGRIEQGADVPGWRIRDGRKKRSADAAKLFGVLSDYLTGDEFAGACKVSLPSVENALAAKWGDQYDTKKAAKQAAKDACAPVVEVSSSAPILEKIKS